MLAGRPGLLDDLGLERDGQGNDDGVDVGRLEQVVEALARRVVREEGDGRRRRQLLGRDGGEALGRLCRARVDGGKREARRREGGERGYVGLLGEQARACDTRKATRRGQVGQPRGRDGWPPAGSPALAAKASNRRTNRGWRCGEQRRAWSRGGGECGWEGRARWDLARAKNGRPFSSPVEAARGRRMGPPAGLEEWSASLVALHLHLVRGHLGAGRALQLGRGGGMGAARARRSV